MNQFHRTAHIRPRQYVTVYRLSPATRRDWTEPGNFPGGVALSDSIVGQQTWPPKARLPREVARLLRAQGVLL